MDRQITYVGALPRVLDILSTNKAAMIADSFLAHAILGGATWVHGLAIAPTTPASLQVTIGAGSIYSLDAVDSSAYGDIGTDAHTILKQGVLADPVTLTVTPPGTAGYSQVFLVQAILQNVDAGATVLSYYNASNPSAPYAGPANSGTSQYTVRQAKCTIALKAGAAAPTGSQTTPAPDAGYTGLYAITVANGQTSISSTNWATLATAPFFPTLPSVPSHVQNGDWVYGDDTGTSGSIVVTLSPPPAAYVKGMRFSCKLAYDIPGATVCNVNALGNKSVINADGSELTAGQFPAGAMISMEYDGSKLQVTGFDYRMASAPEFLGAPRTYYVNGTIGSDSYDGRSATVGGGHGPFATLQKAADTINKFNLNGFDVTVNVADGSYANVILPTPGGSGAVRWFGNTSTPANVQIDGVDRSAVIGTACGTQSMNGFSVGTSGSVSTYNDALNGFTIAYNAYFSLTNIQYRQCSGAHISASRGAAVGVYGAQNVVGSSVGNAIQSSAHIAAWLNAVIEHDGANKPQLTLGSSLTIGTFIAATSCANVSLVYSSISGSSPTGSRYSVSGNAVINSGGSGVNYYPGTTSGTATTGGQYL